MEVFELTGQTIKSYDFGEPLGRGGFAEVYRARQHAVFREVAIKIYLPKYANSPEFIRRFESEAKLWPAWNIRISFPCMITGASRTALTS